MVAVQLWVVVTMVEAVVAVVDRGRYVAFFIFSF